MRAPNTCQTTHVIRLVMIILRAPWAISSLQVCLRCLLHVLVTKKSSCWLCDHKAQRWQKGSSALLSVGVCCCRLPIELSLSQKSLPLTSTEEPLYCLRGCHGPKSERGFMRCMKGTRQQGAQHGLNCSPSVHHQPTMSPPSGPEAPNTFVLT